MSHPRDVLVSGPRLDLARFQHVDLEAVHAFASDPLVCRCTTWGPNSLAEIQTFLAEATTARTDGYVLAVNLDGRIIGSAAVWTTSASDGAGEMGYTLHPHHWGQGYATEVARLLLRMGFERLGFERVAATCDPENVASARVLEKTGLRFEGRLRENVVARGAAARFSGVRHSSLRRLRLAGLLPS